MRLFLAVAISLIAGGMAAAQPYVGDFYSRSSSGYLLKTDRAGNVTSVAKTSSTSDGICLSWDNQKILYTNYGSALSTTNPAQINEYDIASGTTTNIFQSGNWTIEEVQVDQDGNICFTGQDETLTPNVTGLFKLVGSSVSTITTTVTLGLSRSFLDGGLEINMNTGNMMTGSAFSTPGQIWDIAADGVVTSLVTSPASPTGGRYDLTQDKTDGTIMQSGFTNYKIIDGTGTQTTLNPTGTGTDYYYGIRWERASVPTAMRRFYAIYHSTGTTGAINVVDNAKTAPTYTQTLLTQSISTSSCYGLVFGDERTIGTAKTGPGAYTINVNFPGEGGKQYVLALSAAGYSPGFQLADGRQVCLNVDVLTIASLQNVLAPFFSPGTGALDANGNNATGSIALGVDNIGVLVYMVAATLSSGNIDTVSDPFVIKL